MAAPDVDGNGDGGDGDGASGGGSVRARSAPRAVPNGGAGGVARGRRPERLPPRKSATRARGTMAVAGEVALGSAMSAGDGNVAAALDGDSVGGGGAQDEPRALDVLVDEWSSWNLNGADEDAGSGLRGVGDNGDGGDGDNGNDVDGGGGGSEGSDGGLAHPSAVAEGAPTAPPPPRPPEGDAVGTTAAVAAIANADTDGRAVDGGSGAEDAWRLDIADGAAGGHWAARDMP